MDRVPIRVYKNANYTNNFFPNQKPMYLFSSIWNADDWATRGGLEKTDWSKEPFVSSYKDFSVEACQWEDPYPECVSTTTKNWWDQYSAWHLSEAQKMDYAWVQRNLVIYDYCKDKERYPNLPEECWLSPWDWSGTLQNHTYYCYYILFGTKFIDNFLSGVHRCLVFSHFCCNISFHWLNLFGV